MINRLYESQYFYEWYLENTPCAFEKTFKPIEHLPSINSVCDIMLK